MDAVQISIKINQTNRPEQTKTKSASQGDGPITSFDQILAMLQSVEQQPSESKEESVPSLESEPEPLNLDLNNLSEEDWKQLDIILSEWLAGLQTPQLSANQVQVEPEVVGNQQLSSVSNQTSSNEQINLDQRQELVEWLRTVGGLSSDATDEQALQKLGQAVTELTSSQDNITIPSDIIDKIQLLLSNDKTLKSGNLSDLNQVENHGYVDANQLLHPRKGIEVVRPIIHRLDIDPSTSTMDKLPPDSPTIHQDGMNMDLAKGNQISLSTEELSEDVTGEQGVKLEDRDELTKVADISSAQSASSQIRNEDVSKSTTESRPLPVADFVPEVSKWIGGKLRITNNLSGSAEAKFSLYPEHLGHIEIKVLSQQGQVSAQILTDTSMAKEALDGQLQQLRQALQQQGLQIQKLEIIQQSSQAMDLNQSGQPFAQGGFGSSQEQRTYSPIKDFSKRQKETVQNEQERELTITGYGNKTIRTSSQIDFTA